MAVALKIIGAEVALSNTSVSNATFVRVINTGALAVLNIAYANAVVYANVSVSNTESIIIYKAPTDLLTGTNMKGSSVSVRG